MLFFFLLIIKYYLNIISSFNFFLDFITMEADASKKLRVITDFITSLPDDIKLIILDHLSLNEAISTSFLSRDWRKMWRHCTHLEFDINTFPNIINVVNQVIAVHEGEICTFSVDGGGDEDDLYGDISSELNSWVDHLAGVGVQNLKLKLPTENLALISSSLFKCHKLST